MTAAGHCAPLQTKRLFCDSFVLSVKSDEERIYCGLNNGCVQVWNLEYLAKTREQECHDKGVKCMDLNHSVILTGSYDATFKVGRLMLLMTCLLCCALLCMPSLLLSKQLKPGTQQSKYLSGVEEE